DGIRDDLVTGVQTCALPIYNFSWGHTREQISGMLLVVRETAAASRKSPCVVSASHSGMRFASGHPCMQSGFGHWMQRLAWARTEIGRASCRERGWTGWGEGG